MDGAEASKSPSPAAVPPRNQKGPTQKKSTASIAGQVRRSQRKMRRKRPGAMKKKPRARAPQRKRGRRQ